MSHAVPPRAGARRLGPEGFPWSAPTWPVTIDARAPSRHLGADYEHGVDPPLPRPAGALDDPQQRHPSVRPHRGVTRGPRGRNARAGRRTRHLRANHASHVDTGLLLSVLPRPFRHKTVVATAARPFLRPPAGRPTLVAILAAIPDRTPQGEPEVGRGHRRAICVKAGTSSSTPRAAARLTAGSSRSGAGRATSPHARAAPWCRSTSTAPTGLAPGGHAPTPEPAPASPSAPHPGGRGRERAAARGEDRRGVRGPRRRARSDWCRAPARRHANHTIAPGVRGVALAPGLGPRPRSPRARRGRSDPLGRGRLNGDRRPRESRVRDLGRRG